MNPDQAIIRQTALLLKFQSEIADFNLSPDNGSVSRGDLVAELLWIASRIRRFQADVMALPSGHPCNARAPHACDRRH
jgi:hypothetical protein